MRQPPTPTTMRTTTPTMRYWYRSHSFLSCSRRTSSSTSRKTSSWDTKLPLARLPGYKPRPCGSRPWARLAYGCGAGKAKPSDIPVTPSNLRFLTVFSSHGIDMVGPREGARPHILGIVCNRLFNPRPQFPVAADEFGNPRRQAEHVLQHQDLAVAGDARANANGRDRDLLGDLAAERLGDGLDHDRERAGVRDRL